MEARKLLHTIVVWVTIHCKSISLHLCINIGFCQQQTFCFTAGHLSVVGSSRFTFDYRTFDTGPQCTALSWKYTAGHQTCTPVTFTLQAFEWRDVLESPRISLNSSTASFGFPTEIMVGNGEEEQALYFRILGYDERGRICNSASEREFYNLTGVLRNGEGCK